MFSEIEAGIGLDVVIWLQSHSNIVLDRLAQGLNLAGMIWFYLLAAGIVALFWDKGLAWRVALAIVLTTLTSEIIKELLGRPRPFQVDPARVMTLFGEPDSHGLPSGHVSAALVFWGLIAFRLRQARLYIAVACYVALVGWSRRVGGVHYPQDVLGGLLLGSVYLGVFGRFVLETKRTP
jgi:undecaprenyl-diphosphatase